jgi:hypothetical protein
VGESGRGAAMHLCMYRGAACTKALRKGLRSHRNQCVWEE